MDWIATQMNLAAPDPDIGDVVLCEHRSQWLIVDGLHYDDDDPTATVNGVYLHGDRVFLGPIPFANLTNLGPTTDRFWDGDRYINAHLWDLVNGAEFPNLNTQGDTPQ